MMRQAVSWFEFCTILAYCFEEEEEGRPRSFSVLWGASAEVNKVEDDRVKYYYSSGSTIQFVGTDL